MGGMRNKIEAVCQRIWNTYEEDINGLLEITESPIEALFLLNLYEHFFFVFHAKMVGQKIDKLEILYEIHYEAELQRPFEADISVTQLLNKGFKYMDVGYNSYYIKYSGVEVTGSSLLVPNVGKGKTVLSSKRQSIKVIPQYLLTIGDHSFRLDFALLLYEAVDENTRLTHKICLECDGHEYHSTKEAIKRDNKRARLLATEGWTVLRYSGSEIYETSGENFENIMDELHSITNSWLFLRHSY
jgi:hypothetical protein